MVSDVFSLLLQEIGQAMNIPNLHADSHNSCLLKFKGKMHIQIEVDRDGNNLIVGTDIGTIPPGRYRENIFELALKANGLPTPRYGTFAFSNKTEHLVLFEMLPLRDLRGQKVADLLPKFLEKANNWKTAIAKGEMPVLVTTYAGKSPGLFGLIR